MPRRIAACTWLVAMAGYALYAGGAILSLGLVAVTQVVVLAAWGRRPWLRRLLLATTSATLAFLAAELVATRIWPLAEHGIHALPGSASTAAYRTDPELGRLFTPHYRGTFAHPEYDREILATNGDGFRGPEWGEPAAEDGPRVVVLGDSMVVGFGVEYEETITAELERLLRERWARARVLNLAVPGYGPTHERLLLARLHERLQPDLVISVFYDGNDLQNSRAHRELLRGPEPEERGFLSHRPRSLFSPSYWAKRSAIGRRIAVQWIAWKMRRGTLRHHVLEGVLRVTRVEPDPTVVAEIALATEAVLGMASDCAERGTKFLFVRVPTRPQVEVDLFADLARLYGQSPADHDRTRPGRALLEACAAASTPTLDVLPLLETSGRELNPNYYVEGHLNARGNRTIARELRAHLERAGLLR